MSLLVWNDALVTGHNAIDSTHREFIDLVNRLFIAADDEMQDRLRAFEAHAIRHFGEEDALMKDGAYGSAGCHVDEHAAVLASTAEVIALVAQGRHDIGRDFTDHLLAWFPEHTVHMDQSLTRWLVAQATGGAPVRIQRSAPSRRAEAQS